MVMDQPTDLTDLILLVEAFSVDKFVLLDYQIVNLELYEQIRPLT